MVNLRQAKISFLKQILITIVYFDVVKEVEVFQILVQASLENLFPLHFSNLLLVNKFQG